MQPKILLLLAEETALILAAAILTCFFRENSVLLLLIYACLTGILLLIQYMPGDLVAFFYGAGLGFVIEIFETNIAHIHTFSHPDMFGMPYWMPIVWGYGFLLMKRIGIHLHENHIAGLATEPEHLTAETEF